MRSTVTPRMMMIFLNNCYISLFRPSHSRCIYSLQVTITIQPITCRGRANKCNAPACDWSSQLVPIKWLCLFVDHRVISRAPGLKLVVQTLLSSLRPIGNIVLICCTFFIIFGILGVQVIRKSSTLCNTSGLGHISFVAFVDMQILFELSTSSIRYEAVQ